LIDRRWRLNILDVQSFREADCDIDHYLVVAKVKERWALSKQGAQKFDVERFNLRMLNELEVRKQYQIKISNKLAALENLNDSEGINWAWENIKEIIKISAKESLGLYKLKQHEAWFDEECLCFLIKGSMLKCIGYMIQTKSMSSLLFNSPRASNLF
jgi:hypothetical protein